tara:strand:- start:1546 stop:1968 length:423 start_codon:yes stop_codon:yes gene_type:complete
MALLFSGHDDHGLTKGHKEWLQNHPEVIASKAFTILTLDMPEELDPLPDDLHLDVPEHEVYYAIRGSRRCASRMCKRPSKLSRKIVVILAPPYKNGDQVVITAYGSANGLSPREPGDTSISSWEELQTSRKFWATAALSE